MEKYSNSVKDRFRLAIIPSILFGILTNIYVSIVIVYANIPLLLLSPILGIVCFVFFFYRLKNFKISSRLAFLFSAIVVVIEVIIHTYFFGWDASFYFFLFLLPLIFLLDSNWKVWYAILFNVSILATILGLNYWMANISKPELLSVDELVVVKYVNGVMTGIIVVAILIFSSQILNVRDRLFLDIISDLESSNRKIAKQHDQQKVLLQEIHHRVKNNLQIISSLLSLQSHKIEDENVVGVLNESRSRVEAIALIHMKLYQDELGNAVDFKSYLDDFIEKQRILNPRITFGLSAKELILHLDIAVPLGLIVSELITNSVKHAFEGVETPELMLELVQLGDKFELWVKDNGVGLPVNFDFNSGNLGLGSDIITALTEQIDATMGYYNINGASFKIVFQNKAFD